jgi:putative tricarboxylic transport membrane protein
MEGLSLLYNGFINSLTLVNLVACFIGALVGTIVGVLPGLGPTATMALMLPFTMKYGATTGLIMMTEPCTEVPPRRFWLTSRERRRVS